MIFDVPYSRFSLQLFCFGLIEVLNEVFIVLQNPNESSAERLRNDEVSFGNVSRQIFKSTFANPPLSAAGRSGLLPRNHLPGRRKRQPVKRKRVLFNLSQLRRALVVRTPGRPTRPRPGRRRGGRLPGPQLARPPAGNARGSAAGRRRDSIVGLVVLGRRGRRGDGAVLAARRRRPAHRQKAAPVSGPLTAKKQRR